MPTEEQILDACLSYDHSFGLMSIEEQKTLMAQAKWWYIAWEHSLKDGGIFQNIKASSDDYKALYLKAKEEADRRTRELELSAAVQIKLNKTIESLKNQISLMIG